MQSGERIKVLDSHCGSGKTSYIINYINSLDEDSNIIYITPFLSETERIKRECPDKKFVLPDSRLGKGSKLNHFMELVAKGKNIASTHALFSNINDELIELLRSQNYILVLDEVMNVVSQLDLYKDDSRKTDYEKELLTKQDVIALISQKIILVADDGLVSWSSEVPLLNKYVQLKELADREMLYYMNDDLLIWTFPIEVFMEGIFREIFILTYQFDCQIQAYYYNYFGLDYSSYVVVDSGGRNYKLEPMGDNSRDIAWRKGVKDLIDICDKDKLNNIGQYYRDSGKKVRTSALSKTWFEKAGVETVELLNINIQNYFHNVTKSKASERLWTCFKDEKQKLKSSRATIKNWLECNCRASNDYIDRRVLVYPINRYLNPFYKNFFLMKGVSVEEEKYALSEMIQWIFRSAIRNGEPIQIYIPSQRMRQLLIDWLNGDI